MNSVFQSDDYKEWARAALRERGGRGPYRQLAEFLRVPPSHVSQVFAGPRNLTPEQACALARYLGLGPPETRYLVLLVQRERAGSPELRECLHADVERAREEASRRPGAGDAPRLSDRDWAIFYSHWYYSAVRLATSLPSDGPGASAGHSPRAIAHRLSLPEELVRRVLSFLVQAGLCIGAGEAFRIGPLSTRLEADSPLLSRHHMNWRVKALERMPKREPADLFYSCAMSIHPDDVPRVREILVKAIGSVDRTLKETDPEVLACLNIDWFGL